MSTAEPLSHLAARSDADPPETAGPAEPPVFRDLKAEGLPPEAWTAPHDTTDAPPQRRDELTQQLAEVVPLVLLPAAPVLTERVQVRHRWTGTVLEIGDEWFRADLTNQDDAEAPREVAEFDRAAVSDSDDSLLEVGAIFYWTVGYSTRRGTRRTFSELRFRRLPEWTASELERLEQASDLDEFFR